ncbi:MAG: hypothetical protein ACXWPM_02375 [Bdellovibrionota bacterium]
MGSIRRLKIAFFVFGALMSASVEARAECPQFPNLRLDPASFPVVSDFKPVARFILDPDPPPLSSKPGELSVGSQKISHLLLFADSPKSDTQVTLELDGGHSEPSLIVQLTGNGFDGGAMTHLRLGHIGTRTKDGKWVYRDFETPARNNIIGMVFNTPNLKLAQVIDDVYIRTIRWRTSGEFQFYIRADGEAYSVRYQSGAFISAQPSVQYVRHYHNGDMLGVEAAIGPGASYRFDNGDVSPGFEAFASLFGWY